MSLHIVIDGYNLIRQSERLSNIERSSLEEGREALLESLASYRKVKHHPMTVVFDGTHADLPINAKRQHKGINIVFSRPGELADTVIKRLVARERERAVVVSSDREVADFATAHGAATIGSVEFENKMEMATNLDAPGADFSEEKERGWTPTTKKKGPSRRPPKEKRRSRSKTRKL